MDNMSRVIRIRFDKKEFIRQITANISAIQKNLIRYLRSTKRFRIIAIAVTTVCIAIWLVFNLNVSKPLFDQTNPDTMLKVVEYYNDSDAKPKILNKSERQFRVEYNLPKSASSEWLVKLHSFRTAKAYFENVFKIGEVRRACIDSKADLRDIKGYYRRVKVLSLCMTKIRANKIHWDKITVKELPKFCDFEYTFPSYIQAKHPTILHGK